MKRPSIVQALAVINSILVIVMMIEIYRLKNPKPKAVQQFQPAAQADTPAPPNAADLLATIIGQATTQEKLRAIRALPEDMDSDQQGQLSSWVTEVLPDSGEHNRLETLDLTDAAYRKLIATGYAPQKLASYFEQQISNQSLWLPQRQQALIALILLFEQANRTATDEDKQAVEKSLTRAISSTLRGNSSSLTVTALDGGLFLEPRVEENPIQQQLDDYCVTVLQTNQPQALTLKAIDYAKVRQLDITTQVARLIKGSQDAAVAIAAQKYLLELQQQPSEQR